jgi:quercetin dioxygenase-like cupin family protein
VLTLSYYKWDELADHKDQVNPLLTRKFVVGEKGMLMLITLKKGCVVPMHKHPEEQFSYVLKGKTNYKIAGKAPVIVEQGGVVHLPGNLEHGLEALEDTLALDIFAPVRKELLP